MLDIAPARHPEQEELKAGTGKRMEGKRQQKNAREEDGPEHSNGEIHTNSESGSIHNPGIKQGSDQPALGNDYNTIGWGKDT